MKNFLLAGVDVFKGINFKTFIYLFFILILGNFNSNAQNNDEQYRKTINDRSARIVNTLSIADSETYKKVLHIISDQYFQLNAIQEHHKAAVEIIKTGDLSKDSQSGEIKKLDEKKSVEVLQLHNRFIALLKRNLTADQLEKIKDGMTYRVLPITYAAYQDMIPDLTKEQKEKIYVWLLEARELAMDAESSEKKHAVFGKYKGRINNYLSAAGYDLKKEGEEWEKRKMAKSAKD
jgi:hypothetical protein